MTDNKENKIESSNLKEADNIDSDKSFESCVNSVIDGLTNVVMKDDDSEKSFLSCTNQDKIEVYDKKEISDHSIIHTDVDDDDDDIRPGSCRENPSSDEETSSWDESKDNWIYDAEYIQQAESVQELPKADVTDEGLKQCEEDLEYIIENHVSKDHKHDAESKDINSPTFIPTNGKFYMHDLRLEDSENGEAKKTNQNAKNLHSKSNEVWSHDLYDERKQKPISKVELINKYGVDIRHKNENTESKENRKKNNKANNYKNQSYKQRSYYDYEYYDEYDNYNSYYYGKSGYYDYNYYEPRYNSWNRSSRDYNRNYSQNRNEYKNYRSSYSPEVKPKKAPKPPSKYSQISEYTDIKITVNLDKFGTRQIENISNNSNKRVYQSRTFENQNYRRSDANNDKSIDSSEMDNYLFKKVQESEQVNSSWKFSQEPPKRKINQKLTDMSPQKSYVANRKFGTNFQRKNNYPSKQREGNNSSQQNYSKFQPKFSENYYEREKSPGISQSTNRSRQNIPDWANSKFEWDANCDFQDVIEEMPPLTEKEINQLQKRPMNSYNPPAPRFAREKSVPQFDCKSHQNRPTQSFVPKRYSELRNQSEPPQVSQSQPLSTQPLTESSNQPQIINYHHMIPNIEYYPPLLLNMPQASHVASANSPQHSANTFSSIHPPFHQILQPGTATNANGRYDNSTQQQFYIQSVYLPATPSRLNQFSKPFQPSLVAQTSQATVYPTQSTVAPSVNTPNAPPSTSRPVLGRS